MQFIKRLFSSPTKCICGKPITERGTSACSFDCQAGDTW